MKCLALTFLCMLAGLTSCDSDSSGSENTTIFTISGSLHNPGNISIPPTAKLYTLWSVSSSSPDYLYAIGGGSFSLTQNTFNFVFPSPPPSQALNANSLGVGYVMLLSQPIADGIIPANDPRFEDSSLFVGAINDAAIVYVNGNPDSANYGRSWVKSFGFKSGYNFGKGWYNPNPGFDGFVPYTGSIYLTIDYPSNFTFPNWTRSTVRPAAP